MRLSLHPGVWVGAVGLCLLGAVAMSQSALPTERPTYHIGEVAIALGLLLFVWGIKWDGQHWWYLAWRKVTDRDSPPSPNAFHYDDHQPETAHEDQDCQTEIEAHVGPKLEQLIVRERDLERLITKNKSLPRLDAINNYRELIRAHSEGPIVRPQRVEAHLTRWIGECMEAAQLASSEFGVRIPKVTHPTLDDADTASDPPFFKPENNQNFLDTHKRNLAAFERVHTEVLLKINEAKAELARIADEIEIEKGKLQ